jgi:virulence-associated protein VagC
MARQRRRMAMSDKVQLPSGEVVDASDLERGEQCLRCGEFVARIEKDDTLSRDDPRMFRFEHKGVALNNEGNRRVLSPHRSGWLCPSCEHEFRSEFLGDSYEGTHQHPNPSEIEEETEQ